MFILITELISNFITTKTLFVILNWGIAFIVISARSAIHSILFLIGLFIISALMFIGFFGLYFIGVLFIIVYVGAVTVLFLFIIIIIPLKDMSSGNDLFKSVRGIMPTFVIVLLIVALVSANSSGINVYEIIPMEFDEGISFLLNDLSIVGKIIYYEYSFALVVAALLLFIALILAILLCYEI